MKNKGLMKIWLIFAIIGACMLVGGGVYLFFQIRFNSTAVSIQAEITDIESYRDNDGDIRHSVYVTYTYMDEIYQNIPLGSYNSGMYVGKEIALLCDPGHPEKVSTPLGSYIGPGVLLLLGVVFSMIGGIAMVVDLRKKSKKKYLLQHGRVLHAVVDDIALNMNYSVNGRHPYIIYCTYRDEYKDVLYRFKSDAIWINPEEIFPYGSEIDVYVDEKDYSRYYVNTERSALGKVVDFT